MRGDVTGASPSKTRALGHGERGDGMEIMTDGPTLVLSGDFDVRSTWEVRRRSTNASTATSRTSWSTSAGSTPSTSPRVKVLAYASREAAPRRTPPDAARLRPGRAPDAAPVSHDPLRRGRAGRGHRLSAARGCVGNRHTRGRLPRGSRRPYPRPMPPEKDRPWVMRTYAGHSTAAASNALYRNNLAKGQTGLSVAFDLPTQTGYDPDSPLARGEVGKVGVPIPHLGEMRRLFDGHPAHRDEHLDDDQRDGDVAARALPGGRRGAERRRDGSDAERRGRPPAGRHDPERHHQGVPLPRAPTSSRPSTRCG